MKVDNIAITVIILAFLALAALGAVQQHERVMACENQGRVYDWGKCQPLDQEVTQ